MLGGLVLEAALASGQRPTARAEGKRLVVPGDLAIQANLAKAGSGRSTSRPASRSDPPGCSMCLGVASRKAGKGEAWLSSQNRNFENRMGEGSLAWLASAATVAASALEMKVADSRALLQKVDQARLNCILASHHLGEDAGRARRGAHARRGAARRRFVNRGGGAQKGKIQGSGSAIRRTASTPTPSSPGSSATSPSSRSSARSASHFVRPEFVSTRAQGGASIVVAGEGWGSGSSREQAVWALQGAGIKAVIARSFAFIHKRNLVNEALPFLVVRDPAFYQAALEGAELELDLSRGTLRLGAQLFQAETPSRMIQALAGEGGIVPAIQRHGTSVFETLTA